MELYIQIRFQIQIRIKFGLDTKLIYLFWAWISGTLYPLLMFELISVGIYISYWIWILNPY